MRKNPYYWLALHLVPGVGSIFFKRLIDRFKRPEAVFRASLRELVEVEGLGEKLANEIRKGPDEKAVNRELSLLEGAGGSLITMEDEDYPTRLQAIYDPPAVLYARGALMEADELAVSIVGSRRTSYYGRSVTEKISRELAEQGVTVVSGMARGIDSVAHSGAISGGGRTIAVLGCGVDVIYPPENRGLFSKIIEHGAILSEYPMGCPPEGGHFPRRNRIISGLSIGVLVVEAGDKSGSLITVKYALEQGRDVFAVPGNVGAEGSRGTNRLIKEGARVVESGADILEEILPQFKGVAKNRKGGEAPECDLDKDEKFLFERLEVSPVHIDTLIRETRLEAGKISGLLLNLELKGLVLQWPGKWFSRKM